MNIIGKIKEFVSKRKLRKLRKFIKEKTTDTVYVDLGASAIKLFYKGETITYRSSIREVIDSNEVTIQKNAIKVNSKWYVIGESNQPTGNYEYKYQKDNLQVLILFGLMLLNDKVSIDENIKVNVLLPYNQIHTKDKLSKVINGIYEVSNINSDTYTLALTLDNIAVEGETSKVYFEKAYNTSGNTCVVNIGYSTTDIALYNTMNCRESITSINIGTNNLLSQYVRHTKAATSSILNNWLVDGYKFSKEESKQISEVNKQYITLLWNDIYNGIIKMCNPQNTSIIFCGGGALLLLDEFKDAIPKEFNIKIGTQEECIYSDLLGMVNCDTPVNTDASNPPEEKVIEEKPVRKTNGYDLFVDLKNKGYDNETILEVTGLALQTVRNYQSRYNKLQKIAA